MAFQWTNKVNNVDSISADDVNTLALGITNNETEIGVIKADYLTSANLQTATDSALAQAKASGEFDGHTPIKGTDYWTETDKTEIINNVLNALPAAEGESF